jgi:hypothetical protein
MQDEKSSSFRMEKGRPDPRILPTAAFHRYIASWKFDLGKCRVRFARQIEAEMSHVNGIPINRARNLSSVFRLSTHIFE